VAVAGVEWPGAARDLLTTAAAAIEDGASVRIAVPLPATLISACDIDTAGTAAAAADVED
jgi:hypothetical protein